MLDSRLDFYYMVEIDQKPIQKYPKIKSNVTVATLFTRFPHQQYIKIKKGLFAVC